MTELVPRTDELPPTSKEHHQDADGQPDDVADEEPQTSRALRRRFVDHGFTLPSTVCRGAPHELSRDVVESRLIPMACRLTQEDVAFEDRTTSNPDLGVRLVRSLLGNPQLLGDNELGQDGVGDLPSALNRSASMLLVTATISVSALLGGGPITERQKTFVHLGALVTTVMVRTAECTPWSG
jgi:hypothetical protein